jgi:hypothetical protein
MSKPIQITVTEGELCYILTLLSEDSVQLERVKTQPDKKFWSRASAKERLLQVNKRLTTKFERHLY